MDNERPEEAKILKAIYTKTFYTHSKHTHSHTNTRKIRAGIQVMMLSV